LSSAADLLSSFYYVYCYYEPVDIQISHTCFPEGTTPAIADDMCLAKASATSVESDFFFGSFPPALENMEVFGASVLLE